MEDFMFYVMVIAIVVSSLVYNAYKQKVQANVRLKEIELEREQLRLSEENNFEKVEFPLKERDEV